MVRTPSPAIASSAPEARSADSSPPCPSGDSAMRSGVSSRIWPLPRSTAGSVPWTTRRTESGARPNQPAAAKAVRVASSFWGEVRTYQGRAAP